MAKDLLLSNAGEIILYQTPEGDSRIEVQLQGDTVWLSLNQMSELFKRDKSVVSRHIKNVFEEGELPKFSTVANFATVQNFLIEQTEGGRKTQRNIEYYNLDVIISVGYRVKSKQGAQFRIWATQRLKEHLVQGYTLNEKRLKQVQENLLQLERIVQQIQQTANSEQIQLSEAKGLLNIISSYTRSFILLNQFDNNSLTATQLNENITYEIKYKDAKNAIEQLKAGLIAEKQASKLFGNEKDDSFKGILGSIVQSFDGQYLYPTIEEQAAHLLYFTIKNHSFTDGNKRIGSFLFVWFLENNQHRFTKSGKLKINDNALVAQSDPAQKELMIALIVNLINNQ